MTAIPRALHAVFVAAVTLVLASGALGAAGAAWAHAALVASDPADAATLQEQPARVIATFNEPMQPQFAAMTIVGPGGAQWGDGDPTVDGTDISVAVKPGSPAGVYTVNYRATSADGHVVTGSWTYEVLEAGPQAATTAATPAPETTTAAAPADTPDSDGLPVWPFVAGITVIVAGGAIWAVRRRT
ncbi:copper resistance CopC family protein [Mycolicibacterium iranicum]|uniref:Copper resistance protein CopC n=1 Tax=Mycolicibacterium iranicum TaxID=912594 RepID=A0A178LSJ0_MYCIR|nr:copper resistance CopC family protein [Mycolicibacterium iranicum]OAN36970.1 copper resistance protein CopC [Mycolicibacterium iranicum]